MHTIEVKSILLSEPLQVVGRIFMGDYSNTRTWITEVMNKLTGAGIPFVENKVFGVYYDNPNERPVHELRSFQGVFLSADNPKLPPDLVRRSLMGRCLYVKVTGEPMKAVHDGYAALFNYIAANKVNLKSPAGYQVSTFEEAMITTEIYMELA